MSEPDYVAQNRALWTISNAEYTGPNAARAWAEEEHTWGVFGVPEREVYVLGDVAGLDVIELGCGTAYLFGVAREARSTSGGRRRYARPTRDGTRDAA